MHLVHYPWSPLCLGLESMLHFSPKLFFLYPTVSFQERLSIIIFIIIYYYYLIIIMMMMMMMMNAYSGWQ